MRYQKRRRGARLDSRYAPHVAAPHHQQAARGNAYITPPAHKVNARRRRTVRRTAMFHLGILALFGVYAAAGALALATDDSAGATALCCVAGFAFIVGLLMWEASR